MLTLSGRVRMSLHDSLVSPRSDRSASRESPRDIPPTFLCDLDIAPKPPKL